MENNSIDILWKYIVYQTTNLVNHKIYIGVHKTQNPDIFDGYIGNGIYINHPYTYQYAKTAFQYAVKKYGPSNFNRTVLAVFDNPEEAYDLEAQIVNKDFLSREDVYNMVLGGNSGYFISKRCPVFKYNMDGQYLQQYESMLDAATQHNVDYTSISYAIRKKTPSCSFLWSTDKTEQLDTSLYNINTLNRKKVSIYNKDGKFIQEVESLSKASKLYDVGVSNIREACLLGYCVKNQIYLSYIKADTFDKAKTQYIKTRPVYQYSGRDGSFIRSYNSQVEAEHVNKGSNISKSIRLKIKDDNGFLWGLEQLQNYNSPKNNKAKSVGKFDLKGNLITTFSSATQAAKADGSSVWKVLAGTNNTHKQHIYRYIQSQ